jgi:hypothetical protein
MDHDVEARGRVQRFRAMASTRLRFEERVSADGDSPPVCCFDYLVALPATTDVGCRPWVRPLLR